MKKLIKKNNRKVNNNVLLYATNENCDCCSVTITA
jgi:hypothetical protein